jgi:hypothetical protein
MAYRFFDVALWLAGAGHFVILFASFQVPIHLDWRRDLAKLVFLEIVYRLYRTFLRLVKSSSCWPGVCWPKTVPFRPPERQFPRTAFLRS